MPKPPLMEHAIFAQTHILVGALPDIRWTRLMALRTGNFMARKLLSNAQAIAEQSEFEGQNFGFSTVTKPQQKFQCTGPRGCILMDRSVARHPRPWHAIIDGEAADTADSSGDELMLGYQTMWRAACDAQPTDTFAEASGHHFAAHQGTCSARPQAGP